MKNRYNLVFSLGIGIIYMLIAISTYVFNYTIGQYLVSNLDRIEKQVYKIKRRLCRRLIYELEQYKGDN